MKEYIRFIYAYNNWANQRILDTSQKLTQEQFLAGGGYSGVTPSIRDTLVHTMGAQEIWLARFGGVSPTRLLDPRDFGTLALIRQYWDQVEQHTRGFIDAVQDDVLSDTMTYTNTAGNTFSFPRWQTMVHQVNHATQHRAEVALLLTQMDYSPGDLDLLMYMRNQALTRTRAAFVPYHRKKAFLFNYRPKRRSFSTFMLEHFDLSPTLDKDMYRAVMRVLKFEMYEIGRAVRDSKTPVIVVFEGWGTAGKGRAITKLASHLDPRGFRVHPINPPGTREKRFPWMHRFWLTIPAQGEIALYHGSWYRRVLIDRVAKNISKTEWREAYRDIQDLERTLADDGVVIQKFWLHIDKKEQKRRIGKLLDSKTMAWRVSDEARIETRKYEDFMFAAEEMFGHTQAEYAPWTVVSAMDHRAMNAAIFETLIKRLKPFVRDHLVELQPGDERAARQIESEIEDAGEYRPDPNA